jgi:hypothetical protein
LDANVSLSANAIYAPWATAGQLGGPTGEVGLDLQIVGGAVSGPPATGQAVIPRLSAGVAVGQYFGAGYTLSFLNPFSLIVQ